MPDAPEQLLTVNDVAALLRVSPRTVRRWIETGKLRATRLPGRGAYRIQPADLRAALHEGVPCPCG